MWEAPNREAQTGGGDALSGPADMQRPANPWPRLLAFAAVLGVCAVLLGLCVVTFANPPRRELKLGLAELATGTPKFVPVTAFGADDRGNTYGAWVTLQSDGAAV